MILKPTQVSDLEQLFLNQTDTEYNNMAAFTSENPSDKAAYLEKWTKHVHNPEIIMESIFVDDILVGSVLCFEMMGEVNVAYGIERQYWGKGYGKKALELFLKQVDKRPLHGRVAYDNIGSQKILEHNGFKKIHTEQGFAQARKQEIEEWVYKLE